MASDPFKVPPSPTGSTKPPRRLVPPLTENPWLTPKAVALFAAVAHHGMSCLAEKSIPSRAETVMDTAIKFEAWLFGPR